MENHCQGNRCQERGNRELINHFILSKRRHESAEKDYRN
jgi:hypothetical protein